ncbi:MAG: hypothetical protein ACRDPC_01875 [Solirubrobacteraceae bacterium]
MRRLLVALVALAAAPVAAQAQDPGAHDPEADSPSGVIYEIPLDTARRDAAPRGRGGGSSPGPGDPVSSIRSENNFGSSSTVPGVAAGDTAAQGEPGGDSPGGRGQRDDRDDGPGATGGSRSGGGGGSGGVDAADVERLIPATTQPTATAPSGSRSFLLLALGVIVAAGIALAARRATRSR